VNTGNGSTIDCTNTGTCKVTCAGKCTVKGCSGSCQISCQASDGSAQSDPSNQSGC
jgi:hypothetical protein